MHAHTHDLHTGQHVTVIFRHRSESHLLAGAFIGRAHDTIVVQCEDSGRVVHVAEGDLISISRNASRPPGPPHPLGRDAGVARP